MIRALRLKADHCEVSRWHVPVPTRFVLHHVQPQAAGGPSTPGNLVQVCDNCHYTIHRLMLAMKLGTPLPKAHRAQLALARRGYGACLAAGTTHLIPNEG